MTGYFTFQWNIFDDCMKNCDSCNLDTHRMDYATLKNVDLIIEECIILCEKKNKSPYFSVNGNALRLHPDFWKLLEALHENNMEFDIIGNDLQLSPENCEKLSQLGCDCYRMNLDGLRKTHDWLNGLGSYDMTLENLRRLRESGVRTEIFTSLSKRNISQIPWIIDEAIRNKVDMYHFSYYCKSSGLDLFEYKHLLENVWEKYMEYKQSCTAFSIKGNILSVLNYEKYLLKNMGGDCCLDCNSNAFQYADVRICGVNDENRLDEKLVEIF